MTVEILKSMYSNIKEKYDSNVIVVNFSADNGIKSSTVGTITQFEKTFIVLIGNDGNPEYIPVSNISSINPFLENIKKELESIVKNNTEPQTHNKAEITEVDNIAHSVIETINSPVEKSSDETGRLVYNDHQQKIKDFLSQNKEALKAASQIDNIIQSAIKNNAIKEKIGMIKTRLSEFIADFQNNKATFLFAGDRYKQIAEYKLSIAAFKACDEFENAKYCADIAGDTELFEKTEAINLELSQKKDLLTEYTGHITYWHRESLYGFITLSNFNKENLKLDKTIYFSLTCVKDKTLRKYLYENSSLPTQKLQVSFVLGNNGKSKPAATRIELVGDSTFIENAEKLEIRRGFISLFALFENYGKVTCGNKEIDFRIDAIEDPYLKKYLYEAYEVTEIDVCFCTTKLKSGKSVVKKMIATREGRNEIFKQYENISKISDKNRFNEKMASIESDEEILKSYLITNKTTDYLLIPTYKELPLWEKSDNREPYFNPNVENPFKNRELKYPNEPYPCDKGTSYIKTDPSIAEEYFLDALQVGDNIEKSLNSLLGNVMLNIKTDPYKAGSSILNYFKPLIGDSQYWQLKIPLLSRSAKVDKNNNFELINALNHIIPNINNSNKKKYYLYLKASSFSKVGKFEDAIKILEDLKKLSTSDRKISDMLSTEKMIANNYYRLGEKDKAIEIAKKILESNSDDAFALAIVNDNMSQLDADPIENYIPSIEASSELKGYPKYKVESIELDTEAVGGFQGQIKDDRVIGSAKKIVPLFSKYIEERIKKMSSSSKGVGWAFLAKVAQQLIETDSNDSEYLEKNRITIEQVNYYAGRSMLSCGDHVGLSVSSPWDTLRFYYLQALNLVPEEQNDAKNAFNRMICSYYLDNTELKKVIQNAKDTELKYLDLVKNKKSKTLRSMFITTFQLDNRSNTKIQQMLSILLQNKTEDQSAILTFGNLCDEYIADEYPSADTYFEHWNEVKNIYNTWIKNVQEDLQRTNTDISSNQALDGHMDFLSDRLKEDKFLNTDKQYLEKYYSILDDLKKALVTNEFDRCEDLFQSVISNCDLLLDSIQKSPTALSFDFLRDTIDSVKNYTSEMLDGLYEQHKPKLNITYTGGYLNNNRLPLRFEIRNEPNTQSAEIISIDFDTEMVGVSIKNDINKLIQRVKSGNGEEGSRIIMLDKENFYHNYVEFYMAVQYSYKSNRDKIETQKIIEPIHVELRDKSLFQRIQNPYAHHAEGGGVTGPMFYGRDSDIQEIVSMLKTDSGMLAHRGIIMYGQKRAGKSSILVNLQEKIEAEYGAETYLFFDIGSIGENAIPTIPGILSLIMGTMENELKRKHREIYTKLINDGIDFPYKEIENNIDNSSLIFNRSFSKISEKLEEYGGENRYIPLFLIDEFTYIYEWIKKGVANMDNFPHFWKAFLQNNRICSIVVGQDNTPIFTHMPQFANDFACMKTWAVSYLKDEDARQLIEEPIRKADSSSRFDEIAIQMILRLTAGSAFLIVFFCDRLVNYMNALCLENVTKLVLNQFIEVLFSEYPSWDNLFEAQISDPSKISPELEAIAKDNKSILSCIACNCDDDGWLSKENISYSELNELDSAYRNKLLDELVRREVLISTYNYKGEIAYKIKVDLLKCYLQYENGCERDEY